MSELVCPHCGCRNPHSDYWERPQNETLEAECNECGKTFYFQWWMSHSFAIVDRPQAMERSA